MKVCQHNITADRFSSRSSILPVLLIGFRTLALLGVPLHGPALSLLTLTIEELALLVGAHAAQDPLALLLLDPLGSQFPLFGLLFFVHATQFLDLLLTGVSDLAQHLGTEVGRGHKLIGKPQELGEQGQRRGISRSGGGKGHAELNALSRGGFLDPERLD